MTTRRLALGASLLIIFTLLLVGALFVYKQAIAPAKPLSVQTLKQTAPVFDDEFNGTTLDASKWSTCYDWYSSQYNGCTNYGNGEQEWYVKDAVSVSDGSLILTANPAPTKGIDVNGQTQTFPYQSGMVSTGSGSGSDATEPKWSNHYGYYEARIQTPSGQGLWPAFWMLPKGETWPPEIDIMEQTGDKPFDNQVTYFWPNKATVSQSDSFTYTAKESLANSWHTYGVLWQKGRLTWYVDGQQIRTITSTNVPSQSLEMVFDLAVGGTNPGNPDSTTKFPAQMKVDYVRVYAAK